MFTLFKHEAINIVQMHFDDVINKMKLVSREQVISLLKNKADQEDIHNINYKLERMH